MKNIELTFLDKVSNKDKAFFARQMATMLDSGLPIDRALKIFISQTKNKRFKESLDRILVDVEAGSSLSVALKKETKIFDPIFINIVVSGEAVGRLGETLMRLAVTMEKQDGFTSQIKSALYYPVFMIVMIVAIVGIMMVYVIPPLKEIFAEFSAQLPWTTRALLGLSDFVIKFWYVIILIIIAIAYAVYYYLRTPQGRHMLALIEIKFPTGVGKFVYMNRFCSILSMLLHAGTPIIKSLTITSSVMNNIIYSEIIRKCAKQMERGIPLSAVIDENEFFDPLVPQMIRVGEETGKVDQTLDNLAKYFEGQSNEIVKRINALLEPALIVIIGIGVAFIVFSIIMPIYQLVQLS